MTWLQQIAEWLNRLKCWYVVRPWEQAIRVRCGKRIVAIEPGIHIRLPFIDEVFIQNVRQRVLNLPTQTVTTAGGKTITLSGVVMWRISCVKTAHEKLHAPEDWIYNVVLGAIAEAVYESELEISPAMIGELAEKMLHDSGEFGLHIDGVTVTDFAIVKTYRLITGEGNTGWSWNRVGSLDCPVR